jgi:hypothetical protein
MTNKEMQKLINSTAKVARKSFTTETDMRIIDINYDIPYVSVCSGEDTYFFQGEEAGNLIEEATNTSNKFNVSVEDAIIWQAQSW